MTTTIAFYDYVATGRFSLSLRPRLRLAPEFSRECLSDDDEVGAVVGRWVVR